MSQYNTIICISWASNPQSGSILELFQRCSDSISSIVANILNFIGFFGFGKQIEEQGSKFIEHY